MDDTKKLHGKYKDNNALEFYFELYKDVAEEVAQEMVHLTVIHFSTISSTLSRLECLINKGFRVEPPLPFIFLTVPACPKNGTSSEGCCYPLTLMMLASYPNIGIIIIYSHLYFKITVVSHYLFCHIAFCVMRIMTVEIYSLSVPLECHIGCKCFLQMLSAGSSGIAHTAKDLCVLIYLITNLPHTHIQNLQFNYTSTIEPALRTVLQIKYMALSDCPSVFCLPALLYSPSYSISLTHHAGGSRLCM